MHEVLEGPVAQDSERNTAGWRLRTLRSRHGLTLLEVAGHSGLDVSYLSRLERDALQNAKPKPDTVNRVLDALGATLNEREAVYHMERPPLSDDEIRATVSRVAQAEGESPLPVTLRDEHWFCYYMNSSALDVLGYSDDEYRRSLGSHMLHEVIDPISPRYWRVPEEQRKSAFSQRAAIFRVAFAAEEFDDWYLRVVARVYDFPWAAELWEQPQDSETQLVIDRISTTIGNPVVGTMRFDLQLSRLMANPRFHIVNWTPVDDETREKLETLRNGREQRSANGHATSPLDHHYLEAI